MNFIPLRAAVVTAAIYGYFLIFAQFAFVELLRDGFVKQSVHLVQSPETTEKLVLGVMALAGVVSGFFVAWKGASPVKIRVGLGLAALTALIAPWVSGLAGYLAVAILTGTAIGLSTVSLATLLRSWCGIVWVGIGTGLGYACCNLPAVFQQTPGHQSWIAAGFALAGLLCVPSRRQTATGNTQHEFPFWGVLVLFTALVWLDSAAFFIIQHSQNLKSGTWGEGLLWRNAAVHFGAAAAAGLLLRSHLARWVPSAAWVLLAVAGLAVNHETSRTLGGWIYPIGVSLYSVALVVWPGWFSGALHDRSVAWRAAWIYAVAGWFGSANGIGMAQSLQKIPVAFITISGVAVAGVMLYTQRKHWRIFAGVFAVIAAATLAPKKVEKPSASAFERGKQVYISEGCIHCHSQYIRPGSPDEEYWGAASDGKVTLAGQPVLIGNRRQGPDLSNVGARRSVDWLKQHFIDPQAFSPGSPMPSYAYLFESTKGPDLVAYLKQSGENRIMEVWERSAAWTPSPIQPSPDGAKLFSQLCAVCHGDTGKGNGPISSLLAKPPANLVNGPFVWSAPSADIDLKIARIIKFGIPGTDMPGHETLTDAQVLGLKDYLRSLRNSTEK